MNTVQSEVTLTAIDQAFTAMAARVHVCYDMQLKELKLKSHDKKGVPLLYEDVWHTCCTWALIQHKQLAPDQYQLLVDDAGGEFELVKRTLLK